ncbi:hypothetical protein BJ875DRAFT_460615 [Amylocarpus encephaloides]|uniref:Uncharacterized protein n=1 Tax=Amylocarpus encephaloides TaxID=45428 RepID=A0A9P7YJW9_9HELO|nr:hypothetical protein BJ875DRAFT_460615 [Amylocarpus encephaloides]
MCQRPQVQWIDLSTPRQTPEDSAPEDSTPGSFTIVNPGFGGNLASSQSSKGPVPTSRHALGEKERNGATVEKSGAGVHAHGTEPVVQVKVLSKGKPRPTSTGFGSGTGSGTIRQTKAAGGGKLDGIPKKTGKENEAAKTPSTRPHGPAAKNRQNSTPSLSRAGTSGTDALRVSFKIPNVSARKSAESSITSVTTDAAEAAEDPGPKVQVGKKAPGDPTGSRPVTSSVPNPSQSTKESVKVDQNKARHANNSGELDSSTLVDLDLQTSAQDSVSSGAEVPLAAPVRPAEADSQPSINGSRSQEETTSSAAEAPLAVPVRPAEADSQPSINDSRSQEETTSSAAVEARLAKSIEPQATSDVKDNKHVTRAGLKGSEDKPSPSESTPHGKATEAVRPRQDDALAMDLDRNNAPQSMDPNLPSKSLKLSTEVEELTPERMIADIESKIAMWAKRGGEETTRDLKRKATGTISPARVKASRPNPASPPSPISITSKENTPTTFFSGSELQMTEEKPKTNAETLMAKFRNAVKLLEQTRLEIKDADINEGKNEEVQLKQGLENSMDCMIRHGEGDLEMEVDRYERDTEQKLGF